MAGLCGILKIKYIYISDKKNMGMKTRWADSAGLSCHHSRLSTIFIRKTHDPPITLQ
jgi:hypothetical protein